MVKNSIKIGTKREAFWTEVKERCEKAIFNSQEEIIADKNTLKLADKIIAEEK